MDREEKNINNNDHLQKFRFVAVANKTGMMEIFPVAPPRLCQPNSNIT